MNKLMQTLLVGGTALLSAQALAGTAEVTWQKVEDYRDIRAVNESQSRFETKVTETLTAHWNELAAQLPADHKLLITVTDLDLAGRVEPAFGTSLNYVRVLDRIDYPMIEFTFSYQDAAGNELKAGSERLRDMGQLERRRVALAAGRDPLYHEKQLIDGWFKATFD